MADWSATGATVTDLVTIPAGVRELEALCRELATGLRQPGAVLDADPDAIETFLDLPAVSLQRQLLMPAEYRTGIDPLQADGLCGVSCVAWMVLAERLAYGDPGMVLASPGPSLSSATVRTLGDEEQRSWFNERLAAGPTWTFFALTEPGKGSAATEIQAAITSVPDGGWLLNGEKLYIGNGSRAQLGVVMCRRSPGPWGIEAVLVDTAEAGLEVEPLPMVGLRGARISRMRFTDMYIPAGRLLGAGRPRSRRGLYGARQTLLWFRPSVASLAIGVTHAVCDYVREHRPGLRGSAAWRLGDLVDRSLRVRALIYEAAAGIDADRGDAHLIGAAKMRAAALAEEATMLAAELLGPASLLEHPWLEKTYRDARAFEFMEGTGNLHRQGVFQGVLRGDFLPESPYPNWAP